MKYKIAVFVVYIVLLAGLTVALIPLIRLLSSENGTQRFMEIIQSYKTFGIIVFLLVQAVQVVVVVVPPVQIVGGMLFGSVFGSVLSVLGLWVGSGAVFWLVKKAGTPLVEAIISKKNIKKFSFFENTERLRLVMFVLYLVPGTPKDALTYLAALTRLDIKDFLFAVLPARIPSIVISVCLGSCLYRGNYVATAILGAVMIGLAVVGVIFKDKIVDRLKDLNQKRKERKEQK